MRSDTATANETALARLRALPAALQRRPVVLALAVSAVLGAATLSLPFSGDDHYQYELLRAQREGRASRVVSFMPEPLRLFGIDAVNVYSFLPGDPERTAHARREGRLPWWVVSEAKLRFFRPLSALVLTLDHALFDHWVPGYRLHHLVWWLALIAVYGAVLRRAGGGTGLVALALLAFAITDRQFFPLTWIANRHAVVSALPAALALWAHLRWSREGWRFGAVLAPLALGVALLGGETALAFAAYVFAYELLGAERRRSWRLLPTTAVLALWAVLYRAGGYGAHAGRRADPRPVRRSLCRLVAVDAARAPGARGARLGHLRGGGVVSAARVGRPR